MFKEKFIKICDYIIEVSILAIVFLVPVYFSFFEETYNTFELNKETVFSVLLIFLLVFYVAKIFLEGKLSFKIAPKFFLPLLFVFVSFLVSTVLSVRPQLSLWGSYNRGQGFYVFINYFLFFVLLALSLKNWEQVKRIIITVMASSAFVSAYGLSQYFHIDPIGWKEPAFLTGRIFSTLGQPNFLGQYLVMVLPLSVFGAVFIFKKLIARFLVAVLIAAQLACLLFTYSRGAWLAAAASLAAFVILFFYFKNHKKISGALSILLLAAVLFVGANTFFSKKEIKYETNIGFLNRVKSVLNLNVGSNKIRLYYWQSAWNEFKDASWQRKLFGYGPETEESVFVKYYRPDWGVYEKINSFPDRAHNVIFDTLLQFGLAGLATVALFYFFIIKEAVGYLRNRSPLTPLNKGGGGGIDGVGEENYKKYWLVIILLATLAGYFVNNLFSFSLTVGYVYVYIILAVMLFAASQNISREISLGWLGNISRVLILFFLVIASGIVVYYYTIKPFAADYYYVKAKRAEIKGDCQGSLDNTDKVIEFNPMSSFYKERYIFASLNCMEAAKAKEDRQALYENIIARANSIGPREYGFSAKIYIADAKALFGFYIDPSYYSSADKDFAQLEEINPYITVVNSDWARMKLWQKDYEAAIAKFKKAAEAAPPLDHPHLNADHRKETESELARIFEMIGFANAENKESEEALVYYKKALSLKPFSLSLYKKIADIYYVKSDLDKAIWYNKRGLSLNPNDYNWHFGLAMLYKEKKDSAEATRYAKQALVLAPDNERIKNFVNELK